MLERPVQDIKNILDCIDDVADSAVEAVKATAASVPVLGLIDEEACRELWKLFIRKGGAYMKEHHIHFVQCLANSEQTQASLEGKSTAGVKALGDVYAHPAQDVSTWCLGDT